MRRRPRALALLALAPLLGAWCDPDRGCGRPLPRGSRPYPVERERPPVFTPDDPRLPPTSNPSQLRDRHGYVPPGFYTEPRREFVPLPPYQPAPPYGRW